MEETNTYINQKDVVTAILSEKIIFIGKSTSRDNAHAHLLSCIYFFATPWTAARQAPQFMGFPRQEYWSRLPFPPPGDLPIPAITPRPPMDPELVGRFFTT